MSAGFAAADVAVSGDARMGVVSSDGNSTFSSRMRIKFSGSGTTDGGLAFGGSFRANDAAGAKAGTAGSVFISGAFGKIAMGDVDSGDAAAVGQLASVGYTGLGSTNSINYAADGFDLFGLPGSDSKGAPSAAVLVSEDADAFYTLGTTVVGGGAAKVLYTYTAGALTVDASASQIDNGAGANNSYGLGVSYTTGGLTLAAGYGSNDWNSATTIYSTAYAVSGSMVTISGLSTPVVTYALDGSVTDATIAATYVMGDTTIKAIYQDKEVSADVTKIDDSVDANYANVSGSATSMGMSVQHKIGALTLTAFGVSTDLTSDLIDFETQKSVSFTRTGIGASYDLGGGATLTAGAVNVETPVLDSGFDSFVPGIADETISAVSSNVYDIGVNFSF